MDNLNLMSLIDEVIGNHNLAYIVLYEDMFYDIGYRVMKNQQGSGLIPCHKLHYNGKPKRIYFTEQYVPLDKEILELNADSIGIVLTNLTLKIVQVENNGFMNIAYINSQLKHIYIDENTLEVNRSLFQ